jgi:hypothetical protein
MISQGFILIHYTQLADGLHSDLSSSNFESLKSGLSIPNIKSEFPKFFNCEHTVYKKSLLQRTRHQRNPHELSDIVEKIMKLI